MPSPIGHSLVGWATGVVLLMPRCMVREWRGRLWKLRWGLLGCVVLANAPDVDFLPGLLTGDMNAFHHGPTHSLFWAFLLAAGIGVLVREVRPEPGRVVGAAVFVLVAGHLAADWLCQDFSRPYGIPLFWPVEQSYRLSPRSIFLAMEKASLADVFSIANLGPAWREFWVGSLCLLLALGTRIPWSR